MRVFLFIGGLLIALMGAVWALQGAWVLPATFMRGPEWIGIGAVVALLGVALMWLAQRKAPGAAPPATPSP